MIELVNDDLPPSIKQNPTRKDILDLVRSGFFQQSRSNLTSHLNKSNGAGYLLAQTFGLQYSGEGIVNFLNSIRKSTDDKPDQ